MAEWSTKKGNKRQENKEKTDNKMKQKEKNEKHKWVEIKYKNK